MKVLLTLIGCISVVVIVALLSSNGCSHTKSLKPASPLGRPPKTEKEQEQMEVQEGKTVEEGIDWEKEKKEMDRILEELVKKYGGEVLPDEPEEEIDYSKLSVKELLELSKETEETGPGIRVQTDRASAAERELLRRNLTKKEIETIIKYMMSMDFIERHLILALLKANVGKIDEKLALYLWSVVKDFFYKMPENVWMFDAVFIERVVGILKASGLGKEHYSGIIDDLMEMGKIDDACYRAAALFGKVAIEPLLEVAEKDKENRGVALTALSLMKDSEAKEDLWRIVKTKKEYAVAAMKAYLNSGGRPPVSDVLRWLKESPVKSDYSLVGIRASKYLADDESIGKALIELFERGTGDPNNRYDYKVARALWYSRTKVVHEYLERVIKDRNEPKEKRERLLDSLSTLFCYQKINAKDVEWVVPILKEITADPSEEASTKSSAEDVLDDIRRQK